MRDGPTGSRRWGHPQYVVKRCRPGAQERLAGLTHLPSVAAEGAPAQRNPRSEGRWGREVPCRTDAQKRFFTYLSTRTVHTQSLLTWRSIEPV